MSETPDLTGAQPDVAERLAQALGPQYEVRGMLGRGGFAEVFEVWDRSLDRRLAVKVLREDVAWTTGMLDRFRQEARAVAALAHPNILQIHFVGESHGLVYYAMPFIEGQSLAELLRTGGPLEPDRAVALIRPILEALQHAHDRGLVHRDIKPDNIMIDQAGGRPLLVDFGIAKKVEGGKGLTQAGFVVGTPYYMSPEQALGHTALDARTDLYSAGVVLFQMVTGMPPFDADSSQEIVARHISAPPPSARAVNARIPPWLSDIIAKLMAKKPAERFQSARDVAVALDARATPAASGSARTPVSPRPAPSFPPPPSSLEVTAMVPSGGSRKRSRLLIPVVAAVAALVAAGYLGASRGGLVIVNRLAEPILVARGNAEQPVEPGGTFRIWSVGRDGVRWRLVRPGGDPGPGWGMELSGVLFRASGGGNRREITARAGEDAFFAPLVTNATDQPLVVTVNAGLQGSERCCTVRPGVTRAHIGYYPLYQNSTVRVDDPSGRWAMFTDLGPQVEPGSGTVGLRFETADLQRR